MAFQTAQVPFKLNPQDMGVPDIISAMRQGLQIPQSYQNILSTQLANQKSKALLPYAVPTAQAEMASKLAYANLMGPQFLAKLMGNTDILANIPNKEAVLSHLLSAGSNQPSFQSNINPSQANMVSQQLSQQNRQGGQEVYPSSQMQSNLPPLDYSNISPQEKSNIDNMHPGGSYKIGGEQPPQTFEEKAGRYKGIVEEGKESGSIRAKNINDLSDQILSGRSKLDTLGQIGNLLNSPEFQQMRQYPILGHNEIAYYSKFGTPEQQRVAGNYLTLTGNVIRDFAQDFKGSFRKGEQQLLEGTKPNDSDTVDAAKGKLESLTLLTNLVTERARLTAGYMDKYHINKLQAENMAEKDINADYYRKKIHSKLYPEESAKKIKIRNPDTGEEKDVSLEEARSKYGVEI